MKHIIAYSGGHSSAVVAIEVARKFGTQDMILLNHDISPKVEDADIKLFKQAVADYLGLPITYANMDGWEDATPIDVCVDAGTWVNPANRTILCTNRLKTAPFYGWLADNYQSGDICYYGFDTNEPQRITRRSNIMGQAGYKTDYPLALWSDRTIHSTTEIGINPPDAYTLFNHANCKGCLKAGWQHWYVVYCHYPHIWDALKAGEDAIGYAVHGVDDFAEDKESMFAAMLSAGIVATEKTPSGKFWADAKRAIARTEVERTQISLFDMPTVEKSVECTGDCRL